MSARSCEGSCVPASDPVELPAGITVLERGWLSSNNVLFTDASSTAIVDTGYTSHSGQTSALVRRALADRPLDLIVNTHLHSDHCGGNAELQAVYSRAQTLIPPGLVQAVRDWNPDALTYEPTGQECPSFRMDGVLMPGTEIRLGGNSWQVHGAPGHDPHSVILYEPENRILISADALWESGFGVVFQELEGIEAFDAVASTLDLIERLRARTVIPGHGSAFTAIDEAIHRARLRLDSFVQNPERHARHAIKVLLKFKLLDLQEVSYSAFEAWALEMPYVRQVRQRFFPDAEPAEWLKSLLCDLERSGAASLEDARIFNR